MLTLKEFLRQEVKPALGCTEPGAVALAVARAAGELTSRSGITSIQVIVSDSIYKNGMNVGVPGANGARGNDIAAALGVICGRAEYGLEVLKDCQEPDIARAQAMLDQQRVQIVCLVEKHGVYVEAHVQTAEDHVICLIEGHHSNITQVIKNDLTVFALEKKAQESKEKSVQQMVGELSFHELMRLADEMDEADLEYVMNGVAMNEAIARYGLEAGSLSGLHLGQSLMELMKQSGLEQDLGYLIKSFCYAASDARMAGAQFPVMSSAGSGNHGITAILPIAIAGERLHKSREEVGRALIVSHLATSFVKSQIGRLSPVCGCSVAAGAGAAAGLTVLLGGTEEQAALAIQTLLANTAGMICDGAKETCSLKVGTAAGEAYMVALLAKNGIGVANAQGVVEETVEKTVKNIGRINEEGMRGMDRVLIDILDTRNHLMD